MAEGVSSDGPREVRYSALGMYIDRRQATVAEWVALRPILEVCDKEKAYKRRRRRQEPCWRQTAPDSS